MKFLGLLLSLITVDYVTNQMIFSWNFRAEVLEPDLEAISKYYNNIDDSLIAYIHWPESITYRVRQDKENSTKYLKIEGTFKTSVLSLVSYDSLYYANHKFYVKIKPDSPMTEISSKDELTYSKQPDITKENSFLSIKYFGPTEIKKEAKLKYKNWKNYYDEMLWTNPALFLLISSEYGYFCEYTYVCAHFNSPVAEGNLRVLWSKQRISSTVTKSKQATALTIDPDHGYNVDVIPDYNREGYYSRGSIFGVRMATVGFLAEHRGHDIRMLSSTDITAGSANPEWHVISSDDLAGKVKRVEPRALGLHKLGFASTPKSAKFQIRGHTLVKSVNYDEATKAVDRDCPLVIKFESRASYFLFGTSKERVDEVCTSDTEVWAKGDRYHSISHNIKLMYR